LGKWKFGRKRLEILEKKIGLIKKKLEGNYPLYRENLKGLKMEP